MLDRDEVNVPGTILAEICRFRRSRHEDTAFVAAVRGVPVAEGDVIQTCARGSVQRDGKIIGRVPPADRQSSVGDPHLDRTGRQTGGHLHKARRWIDRGTLLRQRRSEQPFLLTKLHRLRLPEDLQVWQRLRKGRASPDGSRP